jgi:hypothetical protein
MALHNCEHGFLDLARDVFPEYMRLLRRSMATPFSSQSFYTSGAGLQSIRKKYGPSGKDFRGCYVFIEGGTTVYVDISKHVLSRLYSHLNAKNHQGSSFIYKVANKVTKISHLRKSPSSVEYQAPFQMALNRIRQCDLAWVAIPNALELYLFEAYACMELGTKDYNDFETH